MFEKAEVFLSKKSGNFLFCLALALDIVIGWLDYITGSDVALTLFYLLPLLIVVWFLGKREGIGMSILCTLTIFVSNYFADGMQYNFHIAAWNMSLIEGFFLVIIFMSLHIKNDMEEKKKLVAKLQQTLDEVRTLEGILPICSSCKNIRDEKGNWDRIETYISAHTDADFSHGICPECAKKLYPDFYEKISGKDKK